ncbi:MAG: transglycosylase domain-containing protein [Methyloceanibacter sp.]|uniref:transglycosylase domain-containing protein n=1 Tax=Methyloceanibacter sp. TaxID=1965321 RepID=UPI003D6CD802
MFKALRFGLLAAIWGTIILAGAVVYFIAKVPDPILATLDDRPPNVTILAADGTVLAERGLRRGHIRVESLPPHLIKAVMATEDRRFYHHYGIDPVGLARATYRNVSAGAVVEGGSTITQQLAKNLFLKPERTMTRKLEELIYAVWLEQRFTKDEILELYLNRVYFGGGTYGVEAAARHYFGKSARAVSLPQSALLAGLLKAPSRYAPTRSATLASARADQVLDNMVDAGFLSAEEAAAAARQPLTLRAKGDDTGFPYTVDWVAELLPEYVGEHEGDLVVETTIDASLQRATQERLRKLLDGEGAAHGAGEGAVVVLDPWGSVKALVGGRSYTLSPYDRAIKSLRQPGSAFKPFVYLAALESGYTPDSVAYDGPVNIGGWTPENYTDDYKGQVTLRYSMAHSLNTVAAKLTADVGAWRVVRTARRLGINSTLHAQPSIALGTAEVTLLELAGAYAPFANGGQGVLPHVITRVTNGDGKALYRRRQSTTGQVVALNHVGAMNDMLNAAIMRGTGKRAAIPEHAAAGKTGTTQNSRDAWFVGYTAHYVAGVWIGNDDGARMSKVTGGTLPAELWHDTMFYAHQNKQPLPLPGTHGPRPLQDAIAVRMPWSSPSTKNKGGQDMPLYQRVLGIFGGG